MDAVTNAMTVDVEEYFQVEALRGLIAERDWDRMESRVERSTERVLELFDRHGVKGTFFTLGWVAERHPALVRRIADAGHEVASHGYGHRMITTMTPEAFREDVAKAKKLLEDAAGCEVVGYRAPTFSVVGKTLWALDVLRDAGYRYDSSIYPIVHDRYGIADYPRAPHRIESGEGRGMVEVPMTTLRLAGRNVPLGGGGYLRLLPLAYNLFGLKRFERREHRPFVVYFHPWELDAWQPRFPLGRLARLRSYAGLRTMGDRIGTLCREFPFGTMRSMLEGLSLLD